jgi:hypothetical protein
MLTYALTYAAAGSSQPDEEVVVFDVVAFDETEPPAAGIYICI